MKTSFVTIAFLICLIPALAGTASYAQTDPERAICSIEDATCLLEHLYNTAKTIEQDNWRDQTLREIGKSYAAASMIDHALAVIPEIGNPDTKAMTIRGIGMELAHLNLEPATQADIFVQLHEAAARIDHPPSFAIALTYIAMAQAFAGDNEGAWQTASGMDNEALRHKAFAEAAEVQAEKGDYESAIKSIEFIGNEAFRNKALGVVSKIFADNALFDNAYNAALKISNAYLKAQRIQYLIDRQRHIERSNALTENADTPTSGAP
jgi:hypothetical protein